MAAASLSNLEALENKFLPEEMAAEGAVAAASPGDE
jgi:hypothetical protein